MYLIPIERGVDHDLQPSSYRDKYIRYIGTSIQKLHRTQIHKDLPWKPQSWGKLETIEPHCSDIILQKLELQQKFQLFKLTSTFISL